MTNVLNETTGVQKRSVFDVYLSGVLRNTGGKFCYAEPNALNSMGWLREDGSELMGWGLARFPVSEPGLYMSKRKYNSGNPDPVETHQPFPIKDDNSVTKDGKVRSQYRYIQVIKSAPLNRKFPTEKKAVEALAKFTKTIAGQIKARNGRVLAEPLLIETGDSENLIEGGITMPPIETYDNAVQYYQRLIYLIALSRERWLELYKANASQATKWHLKRITAEFTSCLALAYYGLQPEADNTHIQQLRNALVANPKKLAYASYNAERYLQHLK